MQRSTSPRVPVLYQPDDLAHQRILLDWFTVLHACGDLERTFLRGSHAPYTFLRYFEETAVLLMALEAPEERRVEAALWYEHYTNAAAQFGLWIAPELRASKKSLDFVLATLSILLTHQYEYLIGYLSDEVVYQQALSLGLKGLLSRDGFHVIVVERDTYGRWSAEWRNGSEPGGD